MSTRSAHPNPAEDPADREIVITRTFDAPRELIWELWTSPEHVVRWWGPNGFTTSIEEMDVRPGGVWKHVMHGPDGTDYPNKSVFREVVKPERIVYSHGGGRPGDRGVTFVATWTFEALGAKQTRVTLRSVFPSTADRDRVVREYGAIEGGRQTLARLAEYLPHPPIVVERTYGAPVALVWRAITDVEQMKAWYMTKLTAFRAEPGFKTEFTVRFKDRDWVHVWEVTTVVPERKIAYRWTFAGIPGESLVTFELTPQGERTRLRLTHEGVESFHAEATPGLERGNFLGGWTELVGAELPAFLEQEKAAARGEFLLTRTFDAPRELVWAAWTDPEHLRHWFGPKGMTMPACSLDLRPGGTFHYCLRSPDGRELWGKWIFREIAAPERLVVIASFSDASGGRTRHPLAPQWPLQTLSVMTLAEHEGKTTLTFRWSPHEATDAERRAFDSGHTSMRQGWGGTMEQLEAWLAEVKSLATGAATAAATPASS